MEYGLSTHLFRSRRLSSHVLDQILAAGFHHIELFAAREHLDYHDSNHVRDVAQWFTDHSVALHSVHAPLFADPEGQRAGGLAISVAHLERRLRIDSMDEIKRAVEIAERLPFRYLILHLGLEGEEYDLRKFDAAFTSIEHLRIFSTERGVRILLENTPNELSTPERLIEFLDYTRLEGVKICFDTGHAHLSPGVQPAFEILKHRVASTHVHDNHGEKDEHLLPFEGGIDWAQTLGDFETALGEDISFPVLFELRAEADEMNTLQRLRETIERIERLRKD
ncbi:MAG TPA: sugar phosphate isomerase/epimerase family protein [Terriglobia bacterium]|nr:sugar phosphate isomerase/epimerase family protein [Terriglobia bacterium]